MEILKFVSLVYTLFSIFWHQVVFFEKSDIVGKKFVCLLTIEVKNNKANIAVSDSDSDSDSDSKNQIDPTFQN